MLFKDFFSTRIRKQAGRKLFSDFVEMFRSKNCFSEEHHQKAFRKQGPSTEASQMYKMLPTFTWQKRSISKGRCTFLQPRTSPSVGCCNIQHYLLLQTELPSFSGVAPLLCINERFTEARRQVSPQLNSLTRRLLSKVSSSFPCLFWWKCHHPD